VFVFDWRFKKLRAAAERRATMILALVLFAFLLAEASPSEAQSKYNWNQPGDPYVAAIGLQAGWATGSGLGVRWPAFRQIMMGINGAVYRKDSETRWNLVVELNLVLRQQGRVRLYTGPAFAVIESGDEGDPHWNASWAVGIEYLLLERLALKGDIGFVYRDQSDEILPLPQGGLFFYF